MQEFTVTGIEVPALAEVDNVTKQLMKAKDIPGGAVAIVKDKRLVFARGYTYKEGAIPYIQPTSLFRIASCSKPITRFAITQLLGNDLDRKVAPILNLAPPPGKQVSPEYATVTVRHLVEHTSGITASAGDYEASDAFGIPLPVNKYRVAANVITYPFKFKPGSQSEYSNYGYLFLGLVIEKLTGLSYEQYVWSKIFRPLGVTRPFIGRSLLPERAPGEVVYHDAAGRQAESRVHNDRRLVDICYGHMNMQNQEAFGGWVLSAPDYARLIAVHGSSFNFTHGGYYAGTTTWVRQVADGVSFVALFNKDMSGNGWDSANPQREYWDALAEIATNVTKSGNWPSQDLFASVNIPFAQSSWSDFDLSAILNAPSGSEPNGYVRADSTTSVVYWDDHFHIHELTLSGGRWQHFDLTAFVNAPTGLYPKGYVRADSVTSVVYWGSGASRIHELALHNGKWQHFDLTAVANAIPTALVPSSYVRGDGITAIVCRGVDDHVHELALHNGKWQHFDLTTVANGTPTFAMPWGYVRADGVTAVVYQGTDDHIHELTLQGGKWHHFDLTAVANATPISSGLMMGYVRADGVTSVLYRAADHHIHELILQGGKWHHFDLTAVANATPISSDSSARPWGYVRADRVTAVVYRGMDNHIHELPLQGGRWYHFDLTTTAKAPSCSSNPMGYIRADNVTAVVYRAADGHIHEMTLK